jgi:hypothetical protein
LCEAVGDTERCAGGLVNARVERCVKGRRFSCCALCEGTSIFLQATSASHTLIPPASSHHTTGGSFDGVGRRQWTTVGNSGMALKDSDGQDICLGVYCCTVAVSAAEVASLLVVSFERVLRVSTHFLIQRGRAIHFR